MKQRCLNPRHQQYKNYGARGIGICERWLKSFENFYADMGERPQGMTLDRKDNDGSYAPDNCRWADRAEQRRNQRDCMHLTLRGETRTAEEWSRFTDLSADTIRDRKRRGLSDEAALTLPPAPNYHVARRQEQAARAKEGKS
jgi:hypothetical protein